MTLLEKIKKIVLDKCEKKIDSLLSRTTNIQNKIDSIENFQKEQTVLLEEILFSVSQMNGEEENQHQQIVEQIEQQQEKIVENNFKIKTPYDVN
jgi:hypothetical protein